MATVNIKLGNNTINGVDTIKVTDATDNTNKIDFIYGVTPSGSVNIKLGNNTITGINTLSVLGVDTTYKSFGYAEPVNLPSKGDIINVDMTGSGTPQQYRVLKVNGTIAEVLAMSDASSSTAFDSGSTNIYEGKTLDTYLNTTWYNTLSSTAKQAIVDKTFRQESWHYGRSGSIVYRGKTRTESTYMVSLVDTSFGNEITRHCYVLGVQDILDYLDTTTQMGYQDTTLTSTNIFKLFWNDEIQHQNEALWLNSSRNGSSNIAFTIDGGDGYLDSSAKTYQLMRVRPAFQIDLSKIEWTPTT